MVLRVLFYPRVSPVATMMLVLTGVVGKQGATAAREAGVEPGLQHRHASWGPYDRLYPPDQLQPEGCPRDATCHCRAAGTPPAVHTYLVEQVMSQCIRIPSNTGCCAKWTCCKHL